MEDDEVDWRRFRAAMARLRRVEAELSAPGRATDCERGSRSLAGVLEHDVDAVPPPSRPGDAPR